MTEQLRVPPHSVEAEQSVLGGLMLSDDAWYQVAGMLRAEDFYRRDHRVIFEAIRRLVDEDQPRDVVTLRDALEDRRETEDAGGASYLITLAKDTPSAANIKAYAKIVRENALRRELIDRATRTIEGAWSGDLRRTIDEAQQSLADLAQPTLRGGPRRLIDAFGEWRDRVEAVAEAGTGLMGRTTGFADLDRLTSGMESGDLWYLGARPSMGKSSMALSILEAIDGRGLMFSLEMPAHQLLARSVATTGQVPLEKIRHGELTQAHWRLIAEASNRLAEREVYVDDTPGLTVMDMRAQARQLAAREPLDLIVVDHLHLVRSRGESRTHELEKVSNGLKAMAKDLGCPVLCLCQLNRNLEQRPDRRPILSDLRQCGAIEQDGDVILFLYRDWVYTGEWPNIAELHCAKQRNGPLGQVLLYFDDQTTGFGNLDWEDAQHYDSEMRRKSKRPGRHQGFDAEEEAA